MKIICLFLLSTVYLYASIRIDSATSIALDASIEQATIKSSSDASDEKLKKDIRRQLKFLIGPLNFYNGTPDLGHVEINITNKNKEEDEVLQTVTYDAKFLVSWDKSKPVPTQFKAILPLSIKAKYLKEFYQSYSQTCSQNPQNPDINKSNFYYYFRPEVNNCILQFNLPTDEKTKVALHKYLSLKISSVNSENKYPEYDKVWEDKQLVYTIIFATDKKGEKFNDPGIHSFNQFYQSLIRMFGQPSHTVPKTVLGTGPQGFQNPSVAVHFNTYKGVVKVNLLLVDKYAVQNPPEYLKKSMENLSPITDVISYNGHSSYGRNIQAVAAMGDFKPERYHLFYFNGCDSFSYVDDSLRAKISGLNGPAATEYQYLDMIVNSMPSYFHQMVNSNSQLLAELFNSRYTFRQLLSTFDPNQKAIVVGEHDNLYSPSF